MLANNLRAETNDGVSDISMGTIYFALLICFMLLGCGEIQDRPLTKTAYHVKYLVTLEDVEYPYASMTYQNATGGTEQANDADTPWSREFECKRGAFLYISAQNAHDRGKITVSVYVNDRLWKTSTSTGGYAIATASGRID
jgi:hypothetical protein